MNVISIVLTVAFLLPTNTFLSERLKIYNAHRSWTAIGILEWISNSGGHPTKKTKELQKYFAKTINDEETHSTGYVDILFEEYYRELTKPGVLPKDFPRKIDFKPMYLNLINKTPILPIWTVRYILKDNILGVPLKSYPAFFDYDGDGKKDLIIGDHDGFIYWYKNIGTLYLPKFTKLRRLKDCKTKIDLFISHNPRVTIGDITGDGKCDFILGSHAGYIYLLPNLSNSSNVELSVKAIEKLRWYKHVLWFQSYAYPQLADINGDGILDLVVGEQNGRIWTILKEANHWNNPRLVAKLDNIIYPCPIWIDVNNDGLKDIVFGEREGKLYALRNIGTKHRADFEETPMLLRDITGNVIDVGALSHPSSCDFNSDGKPDILVGNDDGQVLIVMNKGYKDGFIQLASPVRLKDDGNEMIVGVHPAFDLGDLNRDGLIDVIVGTSDNSLRVFFNMGSKCKPLFDEYITIDNLQYNTTNYEITKEKVVIGSWSNEPLRFITEFLGNLVPFITDWNKDGNIDLLIGGYTGLIYIAMGNSAGKFSSPKLLRDVNGKVIRVAGFSAPAMGDINNDGLDDLISGDLTGRIHIWENVGSSNKPALSYRGVFRWQNKILFLSPRTLPEIADIDKDGDNDIIVGGRFGYLTVLFNAGDEGKINFKQADLIRDKSRIWKDLYLSAWVSNIGIPEIPPREDDLAYPTAGPTCSVRLKDIDSDSKRELIFSYRFGRMMVLDTLNNK